MPLPRMSLAKACSTRHLFFGKQALEIRDVAKSKIGSMISIKEYPPFTAPGSLDGLLRLPHEFILTQSFAIEDRITAMRKINTLSRQVQGSDEGGTSVEESVHDGANKLAGGEVVFGQHHLSVMALAKGSQELNRALSDITAELSRNAIVPVRETLNSELAFWAQLPGNFGYIARKGMISSLNFAGLFLDTIFPLGNVPAYIGSARLHYWKRRARPRTTSIFTSMMWAILRFLGQLVREKPSFFRF